MARQRHSMALIDCRGTPVSRHARFQRQRHVAALDWRLGRRARLMAGFARAPVVPVIHERRGGPSVY